MSHKLIANNVDVTGCEFGEKNGYKCYLYDGDDCREAGMYAKSLAFGLSKGLYQIFIEYKSDDENILFDTGILFNYGQ